MSTISQKKYIGETVSDLIIEFRRDGMPMVSVAMALLAAAWVVLKGEIGETEAHNVFKREVNDLPRYGG
jgi:hypothetical protein